MSHATFSILVSGSPTQSQAHLSAIRFINAATQMSHSIEQVFFYQEAVLVANRYIQKPGDELQLTQQWVTLSQQHQFELQVCIAASGRRGIISKENVKNMSMANNRTPDQMGGNLSPGFSLVGLGQLAAALSRRNNIDKNKNGPNDSSTQLNPFIQFK